MDWANITATLDPGVSQAIATISGALAMLIISYASYKFPKGKDRFDEDRESEDDDDRPQRHRRHR